VQTYIAELEQPKLNARQKIVTGLVNFVCLFSLRWLLETLFHWNTGVLSNVFWAAWMAIFFTFSTRWMFPPSSTSLKFLVDEDSITMLTQYRGVMKWYKSRRTIHRGSVRSQWEIKFPGGYIRGTAFSERSRFGAAMLGFVLIPATLPEYEELKQLAESWRIVPNN
jgi:hypothetical protein